MPGKLETLTQEIGHGLLAESRGGESALTREFWSDRLMKWALADGAFKTQLFRFVDVLPSLKTPQEIREHLAEYLKDSGVKLPAGLSLGMAAGGLLAGPFARTISSRIEALARTFIAGEDLEDAVGELRRKWDQGIAFSIDILGEACVSHAEAQAYRVRYGRIIERLPEITRAWPANARLESDHLGAIPRNSISLKLSALDGHVSAQDFQGTVGRLLAAVRPLLEKARDADVLVYFDMEQYALKELTFEVFRRACEAVDFHAGIALQAYLRSADADAAGLIAWAKRSGRRVSVRLIKGAYWDYETINAQLMGWPSLVWEEKSETDACFERLAELFIREMPRNKGDGGVKLALGTHNVRSIARAIALLGAHGLPSAAIELQMLRGMADELKVVLVWRGYRVREYVPVGEMLPGMAYLVRRLLENSSNEGFVLKSHSDAISDADLLREPMEPSIAPAPTATGGSERFANEPHRDFADAAQRDRFARAVAACAPDVAPPEASVEQGRAAVATALAALDRWRNTPVEDRAACISKAAGLLRERRDEISALMVCEAHKPWEQADADVCEAIDFCEFYAREAIELFRPRQLTQLTGESNLLLHEPRGVAVVISPWNFPLAICTGMTVAALVTGNPTLLKPAEQTPRIALELCNALWRAGVPRDVLHYLPGRGETLGAALVRDPRVATIAFTGSSAVGLDIIAAAVPSPASPAVPIKHVVCEMGGKNAIVVDRSADLDEAVLGVRSSAFSYSGQKCSACSRVIVLDDVHDAFVRRLVDSARSLVVGEATDPATDIGPLIDDEAAEKVHRYIQVGLGEGRLVTPEAPASAGRLVPPHIFDDVSPSARIATEEIFGPVLAVIRAANFEEAIAVANGSRHKLTGGVYSRTPSHLELARREFRVGNLYLNRNITGALVGRQPFGGFGLSGLGTQAGGREYLLQFVLPRTVTENTVRRGFSPRDAAPH